MSGVTWIIRIVASILLSLSLLTNPPVVPVVVTAVLLALDGLALVLVPGWPGSGTRRS